MTNLISAEGMRRLEEEFDCLWRIERHKVVQAVSEAAAEGDRSENAEYIYGKKRLREIDRQLKHIGTRLKLLKVAPPLNTVPERVCFGRWVQYEDEDGAEYCYKLGGPDEFDVKQGVISIDSPVGKALINRSCGDEVTIRRPTGDLLVVITEILITEPAR